MAQRPEPLWIIKAKRTLGLWIDILREEFFEPFIGNEVVLNLIAIIFSLYIGYIWQGSASFHEGWIKFLADSRTILPAIPFYLLFCGAKAAFKVKKKEKKLGQWEGGKFIYNEPVLLTLFHSIKANNNPPRPFKLHEKEIGGLVELYITMEGMDKSAQWQVVPNICKEANVLPDKWELLGRPSSYTATYYVSDNKPFWLYVNKTTELSSCIIKVYQTSWSATNEYDSRNH